MVQRGGECARLTRVRQHQSSWRQIGHLARSRACRCERAPPAAARAAAPRCAQGGTGADVGVISIVAADGMRRYRHDATAVCGLIGAVAAAITVGIASGREGIAACVAGR